MCGVLVINVCILKINTTGKSPILADHMLENYTVVFGGSDNVKNI